MYSYQEKRTISSHKYIISRNKFLYLIFLYASSLSLPQTDFIEKWFKGVYTIFAFFESFAISFFPPDFCTQFTKIWIRYSWTYYSIYVRSPFSDFQNFMGSFWKSQRTVFFGGFEKKRPKMKLKKKLIFVRA